MMAVRSSIATNGMMTLSKPHFPSHATTSTVNRSGTFLPDLYRGDANIHKIVENLYGGDEEESFEVEVPDFHFDWGVAKEKTSTEVKIGVEKDMEGLNILQDDASRAETDYKHENEHHRNHTSTPSRPPRPIRSSTSSVNEIPHISDTSNGSTSTAQLSPPPYLDDFNRGGSSSRAQSLEGYMVESESSSSGESRFARTYASRNFQRVVSAPVSRPKDDSQNLMVNINEMSVSNSTTQFRPLTVLRCPLPTHQRKRRQPQPVPSCFVVLRPLLSTMMTPLLPMTRIDNSLHRE